MYFVFKTTFVIFFILNISLSAKTFEFKVEELVSNLGIPWGMTFIDKSKLLINQKDGKVFLFNTKTKKLNQISNIPTIMLQGQGGLLDIKVSPNYKNDKWIYFTYIKNVKGFAVNILSRAILKNYKFILWEELFISKSLSLTGVHFGSRITFDENNHVYFSIGDRGIRDNAQNLKNHAGSIIRLNLDGSIPFDNPFINDRNAYPEIYSYGHRNPQGLFFNKHTKKLFSNEHGPRGGDEINIIEKGKNYGWPVISYGKEYNSFSKVGEGTHKKGMQDPIKVYIPSIAPSSLIVYSGKVFKQWKGNIFLGALKLKHINRIILNEKFKVLKEERLFENLNERIRNIIEGPNGLMYFSSDSGKIFVIKEKKQK